MVESVNVSPEMKDQKKFLFSISGVTCSKHLAFISKFVVKVLSQITTEFLVPKSIVFFTNSLATYLNYKVIFHNVG